MTQNPDRLLCNSARPWAYYIVLAEERGEDLSTHPEWLECIQIPAVLLDGLDLVGVCDEPRKGPVEGSALGKYPADTAGFKKGYDTSLTR